MKFPSNIDLRRTYLRQRLEWESSLKGRVNIQLIDLTRFIVWDQKQNKKHLPYCNLLSQFRVLLLNYDQLQKLTIAKRSHIRSKAWKFPSSKVMVLWPMTSISSFQECNIWNNSSRNSSKNHLKNHAFFKCPTSTRKFGANHHFPPSSQSYTDPVTAMRLPEIEIERSRWQYCAKQRHLREVQKSVRWWEGQESTEGITQISRFLFLVKYQFGTWFFFWGGCFYFFCDDV